ncbi:hypothetical protein Tco_1319290 [Tanacetum coccineum]
MDANKKIDLEHVQCPPKSKIRQNISKKSSIKIQALHFFLRTRDMYGHSFWHTSLKEDGQIISSGFMWTRTKLSSLHWMTSEQSFHYIKLMTPIILQFRATPPSFSDMVPFYKQQLGFKRELKTSSSFKTTGLLQPWQTLCKIFSKCFAHYWISTEEISTQALQIMQRTPRAPRSPTHKKDIAESSAPKRSTVIRFRLPERRSTRLTPPFCKYNILKEEDKMILQDTFTSKFVEHKRSEEQEARENEELLTSTIGV